MEKKKSDTKDQGEKENGTEETSQQGGSHLTSKEKKKERLQEWGRVQELWKREKNKQNKLGKRRPM